MPAHGSGAASSTGPRQPARSVHRPDPARLAALVLRVRRRRLGARRHIADLPPRLPLRRLRRGRRDRAAHRRGDPAPSERAEARRRTAVTDSGRGGKPRRRSAWPPRVWAAVALLTATAAVAIVVVASLRSAGGP